MSGLRLSLARRVRRIEIGIHRLEQRVAELELRLLRDAREVVAGLVEI